MTDDRTPEAAPAAPPAPTDTASPRDSGDVALLALIDRLASLLDRSDLTELEVEAGGTGLVLRKPVAVATAAGAAAAAPVIEVPAHAAVAAPELPPTRPAVSAPLTGIFYASPAPGSAPYVQVGGEVRAAGDVAVLGFAHESIFVRGGSKPRPDRSARVGFRPIVRTASPHH